MTVALIDDDEAVLDSLRMLLQNRGMPVECFTSAERFLSRLETMPLSCIVSDVRMPGLSGLDLQGELLKRGSSAPLILITGHGDIAMAVSAIKLGAFDFIEKPLDDHKLMQSIRKATESSEQRHIRQDQVDETQRRIAELSLRQRQVRRWSPRTFQQGDCAAPSHQPPNCRKLPRVGHGENGGDKSCRSRTNGRPSGIQWRPGNRGRPIATSRFRPITLHTPTSGTNSPRPLCRVRPGVQAWFFVLSAPR